VVEIDETKPKGIFAMSLLAIFGIGLTELILMMGCVGVFGAVIVGVVMAIAVANRGKDDRRQ